MRRLKFIWHILIRKEKGWIFFHLSQKQQLQYLSDKPTDITISYFGVDERIVQGLGKKIEINSNTYHEMHDAMKEFCERVEKGEVKSVKTYAKFKEILESIDE